MIKDENATQTQRAAIHPPPLFGDAIPQSVRGAYNIAAQDNSTSSFEMTKSFRHNGDNDSRVLKNVQGEVKAIKMALKANQCESGYRKLIRRVTSTVTDLQSQLNKLATEQRILISQQIPNVPCSNVVGKIEPASPPVPALKAKMARETGRRMSIGPGVLLEGGSVESSNDSQSEIRPVDLSETMTKSILDALEERIDRQEKQVISMSQRQRQDVERSNGLINQVTQLREALKTALLQKTQVIKFEDSSSTCQHGPLVQLHSHEIARRELAEAKLASANAEITSLQNREIDFEREVALRKATELKLQSVTREVQHLTSELVKIRDQSNDTDILEVSALLDAVPSSPVPVTPVVPQKPLDKRVTTLQRKTRDFMAKVDSKTAPRLPDIAPGSPFKF